MVRKQIFVKASVAVESWQGSFTTRKDAAKMRSSWSKTTEPYGCSYRTRKYDCSGLLRTQRKWCGKRKKQRCARCAFSTYMKYWSLQIRDKSNIKNFMDTYGAERCATYWWGNLQLTTLLPPGCRIGPFLEKTTAMRSVLEYLCAGIIYRPRTLKWPLRV